MKMAEFNCSSDCCADSKISIWPDQFCVRQDKSPSPKVYLLSTTTQGSMMVECEISESYEDAVKILEQARNS